MNEPIEGRPGDLIMDDRGNYGLIVACCKPGLIGGQHPDSIFTWRWVIIYEERGLVEEWSLVGCSLVSSHQLG